MAKTFSNFFEEFRSFAVKGNVIDLAIGVVIGTAFGKITNSLVADIIMPPLGMLTGNLDFSDYALVLREAGDGVDAVTLNYGMFLQTLLNFIIIAFAMFLVIKGANRMRENQNAAKAEEVVVPRQEVLLEEIRDILKSRK